jgi:hypothetical protein
MSRSVAATMILLFGGPLCAGASGQEAKTPLTMEELPCNFCHACDKPTRQHPCLSECPRTSAAAISRKMSQKGGPDVVILDELENLYLPVPFDHAGHAHMAAMTDGCAVCHHYTPEGTAHPACKNCHEIASKREGLEGMRKPSLKAAYHRQCMGCHREWSGGTQCAACHPPKVGQDQKVPTAKALLEVMPHPIAEPHTKVYELESKPRAGAKVIFRHKEHIDRFGLTCAECHREDSCSRCHQEGAADAPRAATLGDGHRPCSACHDVDNKDACDHCHWNEGDRKPEPFDHERTGWSLGRYHEKLSCRVCHVQVPFVKLDPGCNSCHGDWAPDRFDHAVTGQVLDKNHEDVACADCHRDRKFDAPPKCDECHDADEGIVFPAKRPGPMVIPSHREDGGSSGG